MAIGRTENGFGSYSSWKFKIQFCNYSYLDHFQTHFILKNEGIDYLYLKIKM